MIRHFVALHVGDGFHIASGNFHDDGTTLFCLVFDQGVTQRAFNDILYIDVEGRYDIVDVDSFDVVVVFNGNPHPVMEVALFAVAVFATEYGVAGTLKSHQLVIADVADGAAGQ